jgi:H+/gluconate symporter-like permease
MCQAAGPSEADRRPLEPLHHWHPPPNALLFVVASALRLTTGSARRAASAWAGALEKRVAQLLG